jgi:hypothetical protein
VLPWLLFSLLGNRSIVFLDDTERMQACSLKHVPTVTAALAFSLVSGNGPVEAQGRDPMLLHDANGLKVQGHLQFGLNMVSEDNLFGISPRPPPLRAGSTPIPNGWRATSSPASALNINSARPRSFTANCLR